MKKIFRKMVVLMLFLSCILLIGGASNIYAKNGINNKNITLSDKYTGKKLDRIQNSIKGKKEYRFLIESSDSFDSISSYFKTGDKKAKVKKLGHNTYMVRLPLNTNFLNEELTQINNGVLPLNIGGYDVIQPEIVELSGTGILAGEQTDKLWGQTKIGADIFQEELQTKNKIKVAILDTGIDYNHSDLDNNYDTTLSYDFINDDTNALDDNGHGTQVAGIIGSEVNGTGTYGVNSNTDLVALKVLDANGLGTTYDILEAIEYAKTNNIKVINMSFGGMGDASTSAVCQAITDAKANGIYTVVSAGNNNTDITNLVPASCADSITVGAIDSQNNKASFSNYGTGVILYAPGVDIYSTSLNNTYSTVNGTSFSAPFVTGLVAKELAFSDGVSYSGVIENLNSKYNLPSSIYNPTSLQNNEIIYSSGELQPATEMPIQQSLYEPGVFSAEGNLYPYYYNNGRTDCSLIDYANFSNGYSLKSYVIYQDLTKNIGRTELWKNGIMLEYQDNVFYSNPYAPSFSGNSCYLLSRFQSIVLRDNGDIDIIYNFWDGFRWNFGVQPTKFNINKKSISDISASTYVFGYPAHFYVKLNLKDKTKSTSINIASQGYLDNTWYDYYASNGSWLWGGISFGTSGCSISAVNENTYDYNISYDCTVHKYYGGGAANGGSSTDTTHLYGHFSLSKNDYDLCANDNKFCMKLSAPTNLTQEIQSPYLEKETVYPGEKIGKYQSGSGLILRADIINNTGKEAKLVIDIYKDGGFIPIHTEYSSGTYSSGTLQVILPYLGAGNYNWKARAELVGGNSSDTTDFGTNNLWETDYSLFEGFEPYPFGYKFYNRDVKPGYLTGGILYNFDGVLEYGTGKPLFTRERIPGKKWDIFYSAFDTTNLEHHESKLFDAFESLRLNEDDAFSEGSCYGMAVSSAMNYSNSGYIEKYFSGFYDNVGSGTIWKNIESPSTTSTGAWDIYNDTLKTILAFQLSQNSVDAQNSKKNGITNINDILTELKNNTNNTYTLSIKGKDKDYKPVGHRVVPYKVEGNRIYIWDNNVPFPNQDEHFAYNQFITINPNGTGTGVFEDLSYNWKEFSTISLEKIDDIYKSGKISAFLGFNNTDIEYTLSGDSDLIVTDSLGRVSGFQSGAILEEIPGVDVIIPEHATLSGATENTWKQIYLPQKQYGLTVKVISKTTESYDLMVAGGDYYTKVANVETTTGQIDTYIPTREKLKIDFDDIKTGNYNLLVDDFQNNGTGTVYIDSVISTPNPQQFTISWTGVLDNANDAVNYEIDTDNDGIYDKSTKLSPIFQDLIAPTTIHSFSGTLTPNVSTGSYIETVNINLNSVDNEGGSGIDKTYYAIGTNTGALEYQTYSGAIIVNGLGDYTLNYYSVDKFGNLEENKTINFTLTERPETYNGIISGHVYDDINNNGIKETGENTMAGWKVCIDKNNDNTCQENVESFILTNNDGYYELNGLAKGLYKIIEIPHTNWNITSPINLYYEVNLGIGQEVINKNFGNFRVKGGKK